MIANFLQDPRSVLSSSVYILCLGAPWTQLRSAAAAADAAAASPCIPSHCSVSDSVSASSSTLQAPTRAQVSMETWRGGHFACLSCTVQYPYSTVLFCLVWFWSGLVLSLTSPHLTSPSLPSYPPSPFYPSASPTW